MKMQCYGIALMQGTLLCHISVSVFHRTGSCSKYSPCIYFTLFVLALQPHWQVKVCFSETNICADAVILLSLSEPGDVCSPKLLSHISPWAWNPPALTVWLPRHTNFQTWFPEETKWWQNEKLKDETHYLLHVGNTMNLQATLTQENVRWRGIAPGPSFKLLMYAK